MNCSFSLSIIIVLLVAWVVTFPAEALKWIGEVRCQFRQSLIEKHGNLAAKKLAQELKVQARQKDIPLEIAEELIQENRQEIVRRLGNHYADELQNE